MVYRPMNTETTDVKTSILERNLNMWGLKFLLKFQDKNEFNQMLDRPYYNLVVDNIKEHFDEKALTTLLKEYPELIEVLI